MALSFSDCLREARSIPCFTGTCDYSLTNFLRDIELVLSLAVPEYHVTLQKILCNKLRGKALACIETLNNPTYVDILEKLKEEFGVKKSYLHLRNEATNIIPNNIEDLFNKLSSILKDMNAKYFIEGAIEELYNPVNNDKLLFDVFLSFLPCHIKTLLIQSKIGTMSKAYTHFIENNLLNDIVLTNLQKKQVVVKSQGLYNGRQNNFAQNNSRSNSNNGVARYSLNHQQNIQVDSNNRNNYLHKYSAPNLNDGNFHENSGVIGFPENFNNYNANSGIARTSGNPNNSNSGQFKQSGNYRNPFKSQLQQQPAVEPMEVGHIQNMENFRLSPEQATYP